MQQYLANRKMIVVFLVLQTLGITLAGTSTTINCSLYLNQATCQKNNSCTWTQTNSQLCQNKIDCSLLTNQNDCSNVDKKFNCQWVSHPNTCSVAPDVCQLNDDKSKCNYPDSCIYNQVKQPTCTPKGKTFNCNQNIGKQTCTKKAQCLWNNDACYTTNKCETLSKTDCRQTGFGANYCKLLVVDCTLNSSASKFCQLKKTNKQTCESSGCVWDTGNVLKCVPPEQCTVVKPTDGSDPHCSVENESICQISQSKCQTQSDICQQKIGSCDQTDEFCSSCADNQDYCQVDTCDQQADLCTYTPLVPANCEENTENNQCIAQTTFTSCLSQGICNYQADECKNTSDCNLLTQSLCYQQDSCNWSNVYQCQQVSIPNSSKYLNAAFIFSIILAILA